jgi:cytochrome oxidase Cu insertion factor (SCO1/SenC/PrrC family)
MPDFIELPIPQIDQEQLGPEIGKPFPDVVLPDQSGRPVDLHQHRAGRPALVVFHRSADW